MNGATGVVVSEVTPQWTGSTLVAATTSSGTVLVVQNADDFDEKFAEARWLVIGEETVPRQYTQVQNDEDEGPQTVTLAGPVGAVFEAGLPVVVFDPASLADDKRAVEYWTTVLLDGQPDETPGIPIAVDHLSIPLSDFQALVGARVAVTEDEDEEDKWWVSRILGRTPVIDPIKLDTVKTETLVKAIVAGNPTIPDYVVPPPAFGAERTTDVEAVHRESTGRWWLVQSSQADSTVVEVHTWQEGDPTRELRASLPWTTFVGSTSGRLDFMGFVVVGAEVITYRLGYKLRALSSTTLAFVRDVTSTGAKFGGKAGIDSDNTSVLIAGYSTISGSSTTYQHYVTRHSATTGALLETITIGNPRPSPTLTESPVAGDFGIGPRIGMPTGASVEMYTRAGVSAGPNSSLGYFIGFVGGLAQFDGSGFVYASRDITAWRRVSYPPA